MGDEGIEQAPLVTPKMPISEVPSAESGAPNAEKPLSDPGLALIQERWPKLPEHIKAAVLALVRSTPDKERSL